MRRIEKAGYGIRYCLARSRMGAERLYDVPFHGNVARPDLPLRQTIHYNAQGVKMLIVASPSIIHPKEWPK